MICAIYARKSTAESSLNDEEKSVTRQIEHAKAYALKKGWTVTEQHIYSDDGISGAEFVKRPGFIQLMNALKPKPPFQVLIMSEESRLGRDRIKTEYNMLEIIEAGVKVFYYLTDQEARMDDATSSFMQSVKLYAAQVEREKASQRTYDKLLDRAKAGHVTGGRVFGYDNVDVGMVPDANGKPKRSHVELRVNDAEAAVVRRIFQLYAAGHGFTTIAKTLNAEGAVCPRPRPSVGKPTGWVSSSVRTIVLRRLYVGEQVWGKTKKRTPWGKKKVQWRADKDWIVVTMPKELHIVPPDLWKEAQDRWKNVRKLYLRATNGRLHGRPTNGHESPYLFTGFTACKTCGGSLFIRSRSHGKRRAFHYACTTHYQRGPESCAEPMLLPMNLLDHAILDTIEHDVLQPSIVVKAIAKAVQQLHHDDEEPDVRRESLRKHLAHVDAELARLATAIATGGSLSTLLSAVHDREERRIRLQAELAALDDASFAQFDPLTMEHELRSYLADWPSLAQRHPAQTRQLLRKLFPRRIRVWRELCGDEKRYHFEGEAAVGRFFSELVGVKSLGVPNGTQQTTERPLSFTIDLLVEAA